MELQGRGQGRRWVELEVCVWGGAASIANSLVDVELQEGGTGRWPTNLSLLRQKHELWGKKENGQTDNVTIITS